MNERNNIDPETMATAKQYINEHAFSVKAEDFEKPWGGFFALENDDAEKFAGVFFENEEFDSFENLSPKFLMVAPNMRLSWQYHHRRAEIWKAIQGPVGVKLSETDEEPEEVKELQTNEIIQFDTGTRHRLIGLGHWGLVAEIWKHTDEVQLSDEDDIVRVQDDFKR